MEYESYMLAAEKRVPWFQCGVWTTLTTISLRAECDVRHSYFMHRMHGYATPQLAKRYGRALARRRRSA